MSVHMKKHLTKICIDEHNFHIPVAQKKAILTLIKGLSEENKNPLEDLERTLPKYAIVLRGSRKKECLSQEDLCELTGIAVTNISKMENGQRKIGKTVAKKLGIALKINPKVFLVE